MTYSCVYLTYSSHYMCVYVCVCVLTVGCECVDSCIGLTLSPPALLPCLSSHLLGHIWAVDDTDMPHTCLFLLTFSITQCQYNGMWRSSAEKRREAIKIDSEKWAAAVILHHSADGSTLLIYHSKNTFPLFPLKQRNPVNILYIFLYSSY